MKPRLPVLLAVLALCGIPRARAFWGIGDVSFDPTNYGELVSIYSELQQAYATLTNQLATLQDIKDLTTRAQQTYDSVRNKDYYALAGSLAGAATADSLQATRARIESLLDTDPVNSASYRIELQQLSGMAQLQRLQRAAARNVSQSSLDLNQRDSSQVTAQSTATLAALATAEAQHRSAQAAEQAQARIDAGNLVTGSGAIYRALGSQ